MNPFTQGMDNKLYCITTGKAASDEVKSVTVKLCQKW